MVEATVELLADRPVDRITVREVAERAGHHHRFVAAWFGGKAGLVLAVLDHQIRALPAPGAGVLRSGELDAASVRVVQLLNWLVTNHPEVLAEREETPLLDRMVAFYRETGLDADDARLFSQLVAAATTGFVLFGDVLGLRPGDLRRLVDLQWRLLGALTADPGTTPQGSAIDGTGDQ